MEYKDKVIIIVNGGQGLGRVVALQYAKAGGNIVVIDNDEHLGRESVDLIYDSQGHGIFLQGNMNNERDVIRVITSVIHFYGRIDILINNVGETYHKPILDLSYNEWKSIMDKNLNSVFLVTREVVKHMKVMNCGSIVNILSSKPMISSLESEAYNVTKEGIISMTKSIAISLSQFKIQVNCLSPGIVKSNMVRRLKELGYDEVMDMGLHDLKDIARACLHITGKNSDYVNGSNFILDHDLIRKVVYIG